MPDADDRTFTVESTWVANDTLVAEVRQSAMGLSFARFMGTNSAPVSAKAKAMIGSPTTYASGLMPFGIMANGTTVSPYGYATGSFISLFQQTQSSQGNWHYVDLTAFTDGANQTKGVIGAGGTTDPVSIGDTLSTQPGRVPPNINALRDYLTSTCGAHGLNSLAYDPDRGIYEPRHLDGTA
jgi:hypothetical protein